MTELKKQEISQTKDLVSKINKLKADFLAKELQVE